MRIERAAILLLGLLCGGCATQLYERTTVVLDHPELDAFEIRYQEFDGCLLRQSVPVEYRLKRASYVLDLRIGFGTGERSPAVTLDVSGGEELSAKFPDLLPAPDGDAVDEAMRYRFDTSLATERRFTVDVYKGTQPIGHEVFRIKAQECKAMGLGS